jgi:hypothetical protein
VRFRWARAWEVNSVVPVYDSGDMSSWMTVTSPDPVRDYALTMIAAVCGKQQSHQQDIVSWLDVSHGPLSALVDSTFSSNARSCRIQVVAIVAYTSRKFGR